MSLPLPQNLKIEDGDEERSWQRSGGGGRFSTPTLFWVGWRTNQETFRWQRWSPALVRTRSTCLLKFRSRVETTTMEPGDRLEKDGRTFSRQGTVNTIFRLYRKAQEEGKPLHTAALCKLATKCDFDCRGIQDWTLRHQLLQEKKLSLQWCVEMCRSAEKNCKAGWGAKK